MSSVNSFSLPKGSVVGKNDAGDNTYDPICPSGEKGNRTKHTYRFTLYAIDAKLNEGSGSTRANIKSAIDGHILKSQTLDGFFGK